jgi:hypothetical protein
MPSYLGYQRDNTFVDYATIAKDLSDTLAANKKEKQEKRQELEDATRETVNKLGQYQEGRSQTANNIFYDFADNSKKSLFELNRQLKSGQLTYNDYKKAYQNLQDGTAEIKTNLESWNTKFEELQERQKSKDGKLPPASQIEAFMAEQQGSLLDLQTSMFYTDPVSLRVYHGQKGEDGQLVQGSIRDVLTINNKRNSEFDRTDIQGALDQYTPEIAKYEFIGSATGFKLQDATKRPGFQKFKTETIDAIAGNDRAMASILVDSSDGTYQLTTDASKKGDENFIVLEYDGNSIIQASLTEKQRQAAKDVVGNAFDQRIERGIGETAETRVRAAKGAGKEEDDATFRLYTDAAAGDRASLTSIINRPDSNISNVVTPTREDAATKPEEAKIRVFDKNGKEYEQIDFYRRDRNGNLIQQRNAEGELLVDSQGNPVYVEKTNLEIGKELMNISGIKIPTIEDIEAKYSPRQIGAGFGELPEPRVTNFDDKTLIAGEVQPSASETIDTAFEDNEMPTEPSGITGLVGGITGASSKYKQNLRNRANTITSAISNEFARKIGVTPDIDILGNGEQAEIRFGEVTQILDLTDQAGTQKLLRDFWSKITTAPIKPEDENDQDDRDGELDG